MALAPREAGAARSPQRTAATLAIAALAITAFSVATARSSPAGPSCSDHGVQALVTGITRDETRKLFIVTQAPLVTGVAADSRYARTYAELLDSDNERIVQLIREVDEMVDAMVFTLDNIRLDRREESSGKAYCAATLRTLWAGDSERPPVDLTVEYTAQPTDDGQVWVELR